PTTWHRDISYPGATAHQDRRRAAAHQRSGQLDPGHPLKIRATAPTGAALGRDMEDMVRRLAGAAGGQVELIDSVILATPAPGQGTSFTMNSQPCEMVGRAVGQRRGPTSGTDARGPK